MSSLRFKVTAGSIVSCVSITLLTFYRTQSGLCRTAGHTRPRRLPRRRKPNHECRHQGLTRRVNSGTSILRSPKLFLHDLYSVQLRKVLAKAMVLNSLVEAWLGRCLDGHRLFPEPSRPRCKTFSNLVPHPVHPNHAIEERTRTRTGGACQCFSEL